MLRAWSGGYLPPGPPEEYFWLKRGLGALNRDGGAFAAADADGGYTAF